MAMSSTLTTTHFQTIIASNILDILAIPEVLNQFTQSDLPQIDRDKHKEIHQNITQITNKIHILNQCTSSSISIDKNKLGEQLTDSQYQAELINVTNLSITFTIAPQYSLAILMLLLQANFCAIKEIVNNQSHIKKIDTCIEKITKALEDVLNEILNDFPDITTLLLSPCFPIREKLLVLTLSNCHALLPKLNLVTKFINIHSNNHDHIQKILSVQSLINILQSPNKDFYQYLGIICQNAALCYKKFTPEIIASIQDKFFQVLEKIPYIFRDLFFIATGKKFAKKYIINHEAVLKIFQLLHPQFTSTRETWMNLISWNSLPAETIFTLLTHLLRQNVDSYTFELCCKFIDRKTNALYSDYTKGFTKEKIHLFKEAITQNNIDACYHLAALFNLKKYLKQLSYPNPVLQTNIFAICNKTPTTEQIKQLIDAPQDRKISVFVSLCFPTQAFFNTIPKPRRKLSEPAKLLQESQLQPKPLDSTVIQIPSPTKPPRPPRPTPEQLRGIQTEENFADQRFFTTPPLNQQQTTNESKAELAEESTVQANRIGKNP